MTFVAIVNDKKHDFQVGDFVCHITNPSQRLIVQDLLEEDTMTCKWMDKLGQLHEEDFGNLEIIAYTPPNTKYTPHEGQIKYR